MTAQEDMLGAIKWVSHSVFTSTAAEYSMCDRVAGRETVSASRPEAKQAATPTAVGSGCVGETLAA